MPSKRSAGILAYRVKNDIPEVLLAHPGGPFWKNKDAGAWSIPKGEYEPDEDPLAAAKREWQEETNLRLSGTFIPLAPVRQKSGKEIVAWAIHCDVDLTPFQSNTFEIEWPPKSGKMQAFPEVDRVGWFTLAEAKEKINPGQVRLIEELEGILGFGKKGGAFKLYLLFICFFNYLYSFYFSSNPAHSTLSLK